MTLIIMTHQFEMRFRARQTHRKNKTRGLPETLFRKRLKEEMKLFLTSLITAALSEVHHLEGIHKIQRGLINL